MNNLEKIQENIEFWQKIKNIIITGQAMDVKARLKFYEEHLIIHVDGWGEIHSAPYAIDNPIPLLEDLVQELGDNE